MKNVKHSKKPESLLTIYHDLFEPSLEGVFFIDDTGRVIEVNSRASELFGYSYEELCKKSITDLLSENHIKADLIQLNNLEENQTTIKERNFLRKDGGLFNAEFRTRKLPNNLILGVVRDITERKQIEQALQQSEKRYQLLFNEMTEGFALHEIICDDQGLPINYRFLEVNPMFEKLTGLKKEKIIGKTVLEVMPNTESYWIHTYGQVALNGKEIRYENYSEELKKWFSVIVFSPKPGQFATSFNDITDRKIMENEIRESELKYRTYVNQAPFGVFVADEKGHYLQVNNAASKITGYTIPELLKMKIPDLFQPQTLDDALNHFNTIKDAGYAFGEFPFLNKKQELRWFSVTGVKLSENRFLGFVEDITNRKHSEIKLKEQLDELTRWQTATLGRENRIIELKKEVNQLLKKNGLPVRYTSIEENQYE